MSSIITLNTVKPFGKITPCIRHGLAQFGAVSDMPDVGDYSTLHGRAAVTLESVNEEPTD